MQSHLSNAGILAVSEASWRMKAATCPELAHPELESESVTKRKTYRQAKESICSQL